MYRYGGYFTHSILVKDIWWKSKLTNIGSAPHIEMALVSHNPVVITTCLGKNYSLCVQITTSHKLRLRIARIVTMSETSRCTIAPRHNVTALSDGNAMFKPTTQPLNLRSCKAIQDWWCHKFHKKWLTLLIIFTFINNCMTSFNIIWKHKSWSYRVETRTSNRMDEVLCIILALLINLNLSFQSTFETDSAILCKTRDWFIYLMELFRCFKCCHLGKISVNHCTIIFCKCKFTWHVCEGSRLIQLLINFVKHFTKTMLLNFCSKVLKLL